jgi:hypothetical protein
LVDGDTIQENFTADRATLISSFRGGIGVGTDFPAIADKILHSSLIMKNEHSTEILYAKPKANANFPHFHEGILAGRIIFYDTFAAAETGKHDINVGITKDGVTWGICDLRLGSRTYPIELRKYLLLHVQDRSTLLILRGGTGGRTSA